MNLPNILDNDLWGDNVKPVQHSYTVRFYNPSGFGLEHEWTNVQAASCSRLDVSLSCSQELVKKGRATMILLNVSTEDTFLVIDENGKEIDLESDTFLFKIESFRHSTYNYFEDVLRKEERARLRNTDKSDH